MDNFKTFRHFIFLTSFLVASISSTFAQGSTTTIVEKTCGECHRVVSKYAKVGDTCPHCLVTWGKENTTRTTPIHSDFNYEEEINRILGQNPVKEYSNSYNYGSYNQSSSSNTIKNTNLRAAPNTDAKIMGVIPRNQSIIVNKVSGKWAKITFFGRLIEDDIFSTKSYTGWVHTSNIVAPED